MIPTPGLFKPLSPMQLKVAALVAEGMDYIQIGERLGISHRTARHHVEAIAHRLEGQSTMAPYRRVMRWVLGSPALEVGRQAHQ